MYFEKNFMHKLNLTVSHKHLRLFVRFMVLRQENGKQVVQGCLVASSDLCRHSKKAW